jgi:hypothetical protein
MIPGLHIAHCIEPTAWVSTVPPDAEICQDGRGEFLGYCSAANGTLRVDVADVASYSLEPGATHALAAPHRPLPLELILGTYHHTVLPLLLPVLGLEVIHASAVTGTYGVVALCGVSGAGKSTLAVGLARRGYVIWADDAVAVDTARPQPMAMPLPFAIRLRSDSARFFGRGGAPDESTAAAPLRAEPAPLALLCLLERAPDAAAAVAVERLDAAEACRAALAHAYCFSVKDPARKRRTIERYLAMVARVPAYGIRFRHGFVHLAVVLDAIEDLAR